jgi:BlaI family transcriptional regulator, penicillinase repressor
MGDPHHLAELQLAIMHILWDRKEATVAEVRDCLAPSRPLAHTTVATMLTKMERNGQVAHRNVGRTLLYTPAIRRDVVRKSMLSDLARRLFHNDLTGLMTHLLDGCEVTPDELNRLRELIESKETEVGDSPADSLKDPERKETR